MPTPLDALRTRCLALPEAHEVEAWGEPTFRVGKRMFAVVSSPRSSHSGGRLGVWLHCAAANQRALVELDPTRYFVPPYVGGLGWVGVWIDRRPRWRDIEPLIRDAYKRVAPKRLAVTVG